MLIKRTKIIGIDPDVDKSGFAVWLPETQRFEMIETATLYQIMEYFSVHNEHIMGVVVEAGWLNRPVFHTGATSRAAIAKTGLNVGRNQQRGMDIVELVEWIGLPCRIVRPLPNNSWKNSEENFRAMTGVKGGNPEKRDAAMLVFGLKE